MVGCLVFQAVRLEFLGLSLCVKVLLNRIETVLGSFLVAGDVWTFDE